MSNSSLVTKFMQAHSGNYTKSRAAQGGSIKKITIHHVAGNMTIEQLGNLWQTAGRSGSSHYGVQHKNIGQYVNESDVAWTDSNWTSNITSVTIETSNNSGAPNWTVADDTLDTLIKLVADIAKRNGLVPLVKGKNLTWHQMYSATVCPGSYLLSKMDYIVEQANKINNTATEDPGTDEPVVPSSLYHVQVGAFKSKDNAQSYAKEVVAQGFATLIKENNGLYKVQLGAFESKANAEAYMKKVQAKGLEAIIVQPSDSGTIVGTEDENDTSSFQIGNKVKVKSGAKFTNGVTPIAEVYKTTYTILQLTGTRAVIGIGSAVTGAMDTSNLIKV